jgi:hypothetical protein
VGPRKAWTKTPIPEVWFKESVERFFGHLKQRARRFHNNINTWKTQSMEDYAAAIATIRNLHIIMKTQGAYYLVDRILFVNRNIFKLFFNITDLFHYFKKFASSPRQV